MTQRPIEEIIQIFQHEYGQYTSLESLSIATDWLRTTLETERRQAEQLHKQGFELGHKDATAEADERLREVVGEILKQKVTYSKREFRTITGGINDSPAEVEVIYCVINCEDIKTIAAKHNIDITPNT